LIKRSSLEYINSILKSNSNWNILDIGCGYNPHPLANTICDVQNLTSYYEKKKFVHIKEKKLPFKDNEFDFVIASHVIEHVEDPIFFLDELERISKKGYIEVPTKLEDNLVFENKKDHIWHLDFEDVNNNLLISKKSQYVEPVLTVSTIKKLNNLFRTSLVIELYWENKIDYLFKDEDPVKENKIKLSELLRKYISKRIRMFLNK